MKIYDAHRETDVLHYFPLKDGIKPSKIGLRKLNPISTDPRDRIFQLDRFHSDYLKEKRRVRKEGIHHYYQKNSEPHPAVLEFILCQLVQEGPEFFERKITQSNGIELFCRHTEETLCFDEKFQFLSSEKMDYVDGFDALVSQVQEDVAFQSLDENTNDHCSLLHLSYPNAWSAEWGIGKSFSELHAGVSGMSQIVPKPFELMKAVAKSTESYERIGSVNFRSTNEFNRHPDVPEEIRHLEFDEEHPNLFLRFERQTVSGIPPAGGFLFTIRTYFNDLSREKLTREQQEQVTQPFREGTQNVATARYLRENREAVLRYFSVGD